jgi:hypothetical protein
VTVIAGWVALVLQRYAVAEGVVASSVTDVPGQIADLLAVITGSGAGMIVTDTGADAALGQLL